MTRRRPTYENAVIIQVIQALPGYRLASLDSDDELWVDDVPAFALIERHTLDAETDERVDIAEDVAYPRRTLMPMVIEDYLSESLIVHDPDDSDSFLVTPGMDDTWIEKRRLDLIAEVQRRKAARKALLAKEKEG
jgi:hypothetical protein